MTTSAADALAPARAPSPSATADDAGTPHPVNDLAIRVGTVNGSGSQSANLVLVRALFGMGIPCAAKNVFPSNIEGLPTWFHIRASARGYIGNHPSPQILVCMDAQSAAADLDVHLPGGLCFYRDELDRDEAFAAVRDRRSADVRLFPVPFQKLVEQAYPQDKADKGYRDKLRKVINMVYVGVVAHAIGAEMDEVRSAIRRQFPGRKAKAAEVNVRAAEVGHEWAVANLPADLPYRVERMDANGGKILVEGNYASAIGALFGGASVLTWYPITPSSSLAESTEELLKEYRKTSEGQQTFSVIQAEDELAAIGMVVGAGWAGARALTATSGPGISLMTEFIGMAYFAEIPAVVVDVQRMGPSTGLPTRTCQGDLQTLHYLGHGDGRHPVLLPASPAECFTMTGDALDLAQEFQTPVFVAMDLDLGMNLWLSDRFAYPTNTLRRGKVLSAEDLERLGGTFARYQDVDGDGVPYRTLPGTEHPGAAYFTRGTGHNEKSGYSERPEDWKRNLDRLTRKLESARAALPTPEFVHEPGARIGILAFGSSHWAVVEALDGLRDAGFPTSYCRIKALPVDNRVASEFLARYDRIFVVEQNRDGQVFQILRSSLVDASLDTKLISVTHYDGTPLAAQHILAPVLAYERAHVASDRLTTPPSATGAPEPEAPRALVPTTE
jgi:2-oxoglutarate ferredoxin oxidoreductase subunit alpha